MTSRRESDREMELRIVRPFVDQLGWPVASSGYVWERDSIVRARPTDDVARHYVPFMESGLFNQFAALAPDDPAAMLAFANQYGTLGLPLPEKFDDWRSMIVAAGQARELFEMVRAGDLKGLRRLIRADGDDWRYVHRPDEVHPRDFYPDETTVAHCVVQVAINQHLRAHVVPFMSWGRHDAGHTVRMLPTNLAGAIWSQFARQVAGEVEYKACSICRRWMTVSDPLDEGSVRRDREFCSAACRQKDHRNKVREAHEMRAKGRTVAQIASHFDTSVATIKNWLKPRERNR